MHRAQYFLKAIALSIRIKSAPSMIVSCFGVLAAFLPMLISLCLASFTDKVQLLHLNLIPINKVLATFAVLVVLYVGQVVFSLLQNYYLKEDKARIKGYIKERIMRLGASVSYKYIENANDFRENVDFVKQYAAEKTVGSVSLIFGCVISAISFVSMVIVLSSVNIWIVVIVICTCIPAVILSLLQKDETFRERTKWIKEGRLTIHYSDICRQIEPIKEIRFWGLYPYIKNKWKDLSAVYITKKKAVIFKHVFYNGMADILCNGIYVAVVLMVAKEIYRNPEKGLGTFMLVITATGQLQKITMDLLVNFIGAFSDINYIQKFFELLEMTDESKHEAEERLDFVDIQFENVYFTYPNSTVKALDGISVNIKQGEKVAVVGLNGSGKSTFINLLCGLYKPDSGFAKINGVEITENLSKVRRSISVIFQNFCQYQDTIRNNIIISTSDKRDDDVELSELAKKTGAYEIIQKQKEGLNEVVGVFSDCGNNLSGGEWQKIAITRALYRNDVPVFILDEPTSALDPVSEAEIYRNFRELTGNKTTILISHRLGITSMVDRILVFANGRIVEDGSHDELMGRNGLYARMYHSQARWYLE